MCVCVCVCIIFQVKKTEGHVLACLYHTSMVNMNKW